MSEVVVFGLIERPVADVWRALTQPAEMSKWMCDSAEVVLKDGGEYRFTGKTVPEGAGGGEVKNVEEGHSFSFSWTMNGQPTAVNFALEEQAGMARLTVKNTSLGDLDRYVVYELWRYYVACLKCMLETGRRPLQFDFSVKATEMIEFDLALPVNTSKAFAALTDKEMLDSWLAYGATTDIRPGGSIDYGWGVDPVKITALEQDKLLTTAWPDGSEVTFKIESTGAEAKITLMHSGFSDPKEAERTRHGWMVLLMALAMQLLTGADIKEWLGGEDTPDCSN